MQELTITRSHLVIRVQTYTVDIPDDVDIPARIGEDPLAIIETAIREGELNDERFELLDSSQDRDAIIKWSSRSVG